MGKAQGHRDAHANREDSLEEVRPIKGRHPPDKERIGRASQAEGMFGKKADRELHPAGHRCPKPEQVSIKIIRKNPYSFRKSSGA